MARRGHGDLSVAPAPALTDLTLSPPVRCPYTPFTETHPPPCHSARPWPASTTGFCLRPFSHLCCCPALPLLGSLPVPLRPPACASCSLRCFRVQLSLQPSLPVAPVPLFSLCPPPPAGQQTPRRLSPSLSLGPSSHPRPGGPRQCGRVGWEGQPGPGACLTRGLTRLQVTTAAATALMGWSPSAP